MRRIVSLLMNYRLARLEGIAPEARIQEVKDMYRFLDTALNGVTVNEYGGFDTPETKLQEVMTSADFTYALQEFVQRQMVPGYQEKSFEFEPLVKPDTLPNFMTVTRYQRRAGLDDLEYVGEKGEARPGSMVDATKRQYRVYKFEKQFDFSMEALVNDDLGYFADTAMEMGRAARRSLEKFVSRMMTNAVTVARLIALGALYSTTGRLTTARISEARMAFNQRLNDRGEPINASLRYIVFPSGLVDTVATIQNSTLVPELATNAVNVVKGTFVPIENPFIAAVAPNLPWWAFSDWRANGIVPFVLARRQGVPAPLLLRKRSDIESITSLTGGGGVVPPIMGDFATGNVVVKVHDEWGTYIDGTQGNLFDARGAYYSSGTAA